MLVWLDEMGRVTGWSLSLVMSVVQDPVLEDSSG